VDKELFDRVQAVIAQRNDTRASSHRFAYTGLLKCARCGCSVTAEIKKERYVYYHCTFDKGNCGSAYVREEALEREFEWILGEFALLERSLRLDARGAAPERPGEGRVHQALNRAAARLVRQTPEPD